MIEQPPLETVGSGFRLTLSVRLAVLGMLLFVEKQGLEALVDEEHARTAQGLGAFLRYAQHWGFRYLVTFMAALLVFGLVRAKQYSQVDELPSRIARIRLRWIVAHAFLIVALAQLSYFLYRGDQTIFGFAAVAILWLIFCAAAVLAASVGLIPSKIWLVAIRSLGFGWAYAAGVALLATGAWLESENIWSSTTATTFALVKWLLQLILPALIVEPATRVIRTPNFAVEITQVCSGLEGLGLTLAFSTMWLVYFRREYIFPRALILIPFSLVTIFVMNSLRIAALLLIGNAGFPDVALYGFHSQAGWIAFNMVACAIVFVSRRSAWLNRTASAAVSTDFDNCTATYLVPLLAILAAGMLSHALSGRFEVFYPLRLIAAISAFLIYRRALVAIPWRCTWRGPATGAGVFLIWAGASRWLLPPAAMPDSLIAMSPTARNLWITSHVLTSVAFVPIAEELAYRGYLMRRLVSSDFESVLYRSVRWQALAITAVAFGAAHGALWFPAMLAGVAYGLLASRSESLGEAVAGHATTNSLIAIAVMSGNQWQLW